MTHLTRRVHVTRFRPAGAEPSVPVATRREERLAVEAPLQVRVATAGEQLRPVARVMRTPGHDLDLAVGLLVALGAVRSPDDVLSASLLEGDDIGAGVAVRLAPHVAVPAGAAPGGSGDRSTAACGVVDPGDVARLAVRPPASDPPAGGPPVAPASLLALPDVLVRCRRAPGPPARTTSALLAGPAAGGDPPPAVVLREDTDPCHAVDKVVGWSLRHGRLPLRDHTLLVDGGAGFGLVERAWLAGLPVLATTSAPTSAAVELAEHAGLALVALAGAELLTVYSGAERLAAD